MDLFVFQKINPVKDIFGLVYLLDIKIFNGVNQFSGKWFWLDALAIFFARYFEYVLIFCLFLFLLKSFKKYRPMIIQAFLAAILARLVIAEIIRYFLPRKRPFLELQINPFLYSFSNSFPSGHAAFYFAIATVVYFYNKKAGILFFTGSFLIAIARVFAGLHWPSDILAGALIGILSGWLVILLSRRFFSASPRQPPQSG